MRSTVNFPNHHHMEPGLRSPEIGQIYVHEYDMDMWLYVYIYIYYMYMTVSM